LEPLGGRLLVQVLDERPGFTEQDDERATYAEKIGPEDRQLDPGRPATELECAVRALHPHIGARLPLADGSALGVLSATAVDSGPEAGRLAADGDRLLLGCADGALALLEVKPAGGRPMDADAFLRGHDLPEVAVGEH
jgi:methionyl-tRNA formyltransferase